MAQKQQEQLLIQQFPLPPSSKDQDSLRGKDGTSKRNGFNYKPGMLRTPSLVLLFLYGLVLIGLLEFAIVKLPHEGDTMASMIANHSLPRREADWPRARDVYNQSMTPEPTLSMARTAYVSPEGTQTISTTSSSSASAYVNSDGTVVASSTAATAAASAYVSPDGTQTTQPPESAPPSAYMSPDGTLSTLIDSTVDVTAYVSPDGTQTTQPAESTPQSAYAQPSGQQAVSNPTTIAASTISSAYVQPSGVLDSKTSSTTASAYVSSDGTRIPTAVTSLQVYTAFVQPDGTRTSVVTLYTASSTVPSPSTNATDSSLHDQNSNIITYHWSIGSAFLATYLPVLLAVVFRLLMSVVLSELSLIDPFRQMASPNGAMAERALLAFYQTSSGLLSPFKALRHSRWAVAVVGMAYAASCLVPALSSEAIWVTTRYNCEDPFYANTNNPCAPRATASQPVIRLLQGLLAFDILVVFALTVLMIFSRTGLPANPSSIATVASLMQHPGLVEDLCEMPLGQEASAQSVATALREKRYILDFWRSDNGGTCYGIRPVHSIQVEDQYRPPQRDSRSYESVSGGSSHGTEHNMPRYRWKDFLLAFVVLGTFGVVLAYYLDGADDPFNRFFNSNTFGPRFVLTLAATTIAGMWKTVEQSSVVMAPFIRLSQRPSSAGSTICFAPSNVPILSTWRTLRSRYWLLTALTITTLLAEVLSIVISSIPYAYGMLWAQFIACAYMSIGILAIMIIVSVLVIFHRRREPRIPARPDTLGMKMYYIAGSRMLDDFDGVEWESAGMRDRRVRSLRKKYGFAMMMRRDGRTNWLVDEVGDR